MTFDAEGIRSVNAVYVQVYQPGVRGLFSGLQLRFLTASIQCSLHHSAGYPKRVTLGTVKEVVQKEKRFYSSEAQVWPGESFQCGFIAVS